MREGRARLRIGYVVGGLSRGGSEMQLLRLAGGLVARGHAAHVIAYGGPSVLDEEFRSAGVAVVVGRGGGQVEKVRLVRAWMRRSEFDVVHAVLRRASSLTLLARWPARRPPVITTDMSSATYARRTPALRAALAGFAWADRVVTQTELNRSSLERLAPWLRGKTVVIRNGLDTARFSPNEAATVSRGPAFAFCAMGTISTVKNPFRVVDAVAELRRRGHESFRVDWYGRDGSSRRENVGARARAYAVTRGVDAHLVFHGETADVEAAYGSADAFLHASVREGFPNVVVEAMACGLPVVVSRVADLPQIVAAARNGFVFDETEPVSIADAMERLMTVPRHERAAMGARSRAFAVASFHVERFLDEFEHLYRDLATGRGESTSAT